MSQRSKEGYLLVDNRFAPGPAVLALPNGREVVVPSGGGVLEVATYTCSHCNAQVIRNPARQRDRAWCWSCDHVICDPCALLRRTQPCVPMARRLEEGQTAAERLLVRGRI